MRHDRTVTGSGKHGFDENSTTTSADLREHHFSFKGVFARMMAGLAAEHDEEKTVMIDATYAPGPKAGEQIAKIVRGCSDN